ncbi:DUF6349 family protein [Streptomyces sp. NPDC005407]|uniref:DUF6349 family protein n=1 Tax=Streptomyces sp. NPDC005407 TaxID=3155340 RepID=UPI0033A2382D
MTTPAEPVGAVARHTAYLPRFWDKTQNVREVWRIDWGHPGFTHRTPPEPTADHQPTVIVPARKPAPHRPTTLLRADEIAHSERQIARLTELEARQATVLANTRQALRKHREHLKWARRELAAEIAAVHRLEHAEGASGAGSGSTTPGRNA